jgi:hypothetical protein
MGQRPYEPRAAPKLNRAIIEKRRGLLGCFAVIAADDGSEKCPPLPTKYARYSAIRSCLLGPVRSRRLTRVGTKPF